MVHGREQGNDVEDPALPNGMKRPGAVFAAAPSQPSFRTRSKVIQIVQPNFARSIVKQVSGAHGAKTSKISSPAGLNFDRRNAAFHLIDRRLRTQKFDHLRQLELIWIISMQGAGNLKPHEHGSKDERLVSSIVTPWQILPE